MSENQKVLVTGALGMLGADIVQTLECTGRFDVIKTDVDELDITNVATVRDLMMAEKFCMCGPVITALPAAMASIGF